MKVLLFLAVALFLGLFAENSNAEVNGNSPPLALDAECKSHPLPPGHVAVGELHSPECGTNPREMNAWYIDKVRDKIVTCTVPDYANAYPPVIAYRVCRRVSAPACPPLLDGSPNGYELSSLNSRCDGPFGISRCGRPSGIRAAGAQWEHFAPDLSCADKVRFTEFNIRPVYPIPVCVAHNEKAIERIGNEMQSNLPWGVVIRRFFSDSCPELPDAKPNAVVIATVPVEFWRNEEKVFACSISLQKRWQLGDSPDGPLKIGVYFRKLGVIPPGAHGKGGVIIDGPQHTITFETFHDDRCGLGREINALNMKVRN
ncbi:hypothetical protein [Bradyrhizobium sp. WSM2254]|uniref:hypothetical protein n=1 Tax=Bradyrhizobium sp. WSM2254 TaxID=1188263 RepID=UPI0012EB57D2|nr:hypothetical protein [Bradyrhizobium sp. WSM2254]